MGLLTLCTSSAMQAAARAHESGSPPGQWEAAAVQRLRKLGAGGELAVKALQKELIKAAKKAMQEQVRRGIALTFSAAHHPYSRSSSRCLR